MDPIKDAFEKIKIDIFLLKQEINSLQARLSEINSSISTIKTQTMQVNNQTIPTQTDVQTDNPTQNQTIQQPLEALKQPNLAFSIGNRGVPTDKQTNRQTNQQTDNYSENPEIGPNITKNNDFEQAKYILDSLDSLKREIRLKFKRLTNQEMLVFSTLYSLEEQNIDEITYKLLANNINLTESSIRDYINKLTQKGIPILKVRQNNKKITLKISPDLQKIASLSTILKLREL